MLAQFFYQPVENGVDEDGVASYQDVVYVTINRDITHTVTREATEDDFERFPAEYKYFTKAAAKYEPLTEGLPIEFWPIASPANVAGLKARDVRTVQQLAKMNPQSVPPFVSELIKHAQNYMRIAGEASESTKTVTKLMEHNALLQEEVRGLKGEIAGLKRLLGEKEKAA